VAAEDEPPRHDGDPAASRAGPTTDAFTHLPHLRERVTPAERSDLRVTPEVLAVWDRRAREMGRPANWRLTDQELEASRRAVLGDLGDAQDFWIYSYGSLLWDPGFHFVEVRLAELDGYERRFSSRTRIGRGSEERPGLMLSLEAGVGPCKGLAFRVAADLAETETAILWRREMIRGTYRPAVLPVRTPQGEIRALVFTANRVHPDHVGELPLDETAALIARGVGILGTNLGYLEQLAEQLERLGIEDAYLTRLLAQVHAGRDAP
jgi:glutathione-specific gamma-glutamylcyclotransferase